MQRHMAKAGQLNMPGRGMLKLALMMYADRAGENCECFPLRETIAKAVGIEVDTLKRYIRELVNLGILIPVEGGEGGGRRRSTLYELNLDRAEDHFGTLAVPERISEKERRRRAAEKREKQAADRQKKRGQIRPGFDKPADSAPKDQNGGRSAAKPGHIDRETGADSTRPYEQSEKTDTRAREAGRPQGPAPPARQDGAKGKIGDRWASEIRPALKAKIGGPQYRAWIFPDDKDMRPAVVADTGEVLVLRAGTRFMRDWLQSNLHSILEAHAGCRVEIVYGPWQELLVTYRAEVDASWERLKSKEGQSTNEGEKVENAKTRSAEK